MNQQANAPVQEHHRLAVLHVNGYTDEWLTADGREKHYVTKWLRGQLPPAQNTQATGQWDQFAQALANAERDGAREREAYAEGMRRIFDRIDRVIADELGQHPKSWAPPPETPLNLDSSGIARAVGDVYAFHDAMDVPMLEAPGWPGYTRATLRMKLVREEFEEFRVAMCCNPDSRTTVDTIWEGTPSPENERKQICDIADALADLIYVAIGTALEFGIPFNRVWSAVQRANMAKVGGSVREDGKRLKPPGWTPPDIEAAVYGSTTVVVNAEDQAALDRLKKLTT